jgi:site-specific recombinase XerD
MKTELVEAPKVNAPVTNGELILPAVIADVGEKASKRFIEFFTAAIHHDNTREAYGRAVADILAYCHRHRLTLTGIEPVHVAAYIENLTREKSAPTVKQHLAAIRLCFDWLTSGGCMEFNPAS